MVRNIDMFFVIFTRIEQHDILQLRYCVKSAYSKKPGCIENWDALNFMQLNSTKAKVRINAEMRNMYDEILQREALIGWHTILEVIIGWHTS